MAASDWTKATIHSAEKPKIEWLRYFYPRESEAGLLRLLLDAEIRRIRKRQHLSAEQLEQLRQMGL